MKNLVVLISALVLSVAVNAQSTWHDVYTLFQTGCTQSSCHNHADAIGNLDLQGTGADTTQRMDDVYNHIYFGTPSNSFAANKKYRLCYPGNPYQSFLFRKMNNDLAPDVVLDSLEGLPCPQAGSALSNEQIELVRQWILQGCDKTGNVVDQSLIHDYYTNGGIASLDNAPLPPAEGEGFQVHLGPFFIAPNGEQEFFNLMDTHMPQSAEINRVQVFMGSYSHHSIVYRLNDTTNITHSSYGIRGIDFSNDLRYVVATQEPFDFDLPNGTAFEFLANTKLDMDSHYINYSPDKVVSCDVYVNFYTQPNGTALDIMQSDLLPNYNLALPPNGDTTTYTTSSTSIINYHVPIYIWMLSSHTHHLGADFDIYDRNTNGTKGTQIFDASCENGIPGCASPYYDYQHPPYMYFMPFKQVWLDKGVIFEAKYVNNGAGWVYWGPTSQDEMDIMGLMYTTDTTGLGALNTSVQTPVSELKPVRIYPNPLQDYALIDLSEVNIGDHGSFALYDLMGRKVKELALENNKQFVLYRDQLDAGVYVYRVTNNQVVVASGKVVID